MSDRNLCTPDTCDVRNVYVDYYMRNSGALHSEVEAEFDRWLAAHDAQVKRDAAREALDGYADALNRNRSAAVWDWPDFVTDVREWAFYNYPEETP